MKKKGKKKLQTLNSSKDYAEYKKKTDKIFEAKPKVPQFAKDIVGSDPGPGGQAIDENVSIDDFQE